MNTHFDAVIVGSGLAGALVALELGSAGLRVLVLEAGPDLGDDREGLLERLLSSTVRGPELPYAAAPLDPAGENAPMPSGASLTLERWQDTGQSYYIQRGPLPFGAPYVRVGGGSTLAWLGTCLRLLPSDLCLKTRYGVGKDWPVAYAELRPWYERAELELGVAASARDQAYLGVELGPHYEFPMPPVPQSHLDRVFAHRLDGVVLEGTPIQLRSLPQARNTRPNGDRSLCSGSATCVPFCPSGAKYDATVTLKRALATGNVEVRYRAVARRLLVGEGGRAITGVEYLEYDAHDGPCTGRSTATGTVCVLAANGIETPKLLLASRTDQLSGGVANSSDQVGRNLMDHVVHLAWGLASEPVFPYRGPLVTSGIEDLRDGPFRRDRAAFRIDVGNDGWQWPIGDPYVTVSDFIDGTNHSGLNPGCLSRSGAALERALRDLLTRQVRFAFLLEQLPDPDNRVTLSSDTDRLGLPRPELRYDLCAYTRHGLAASRRTARALFAHLGATEYTRPGAGPGILPIGAETIGFHGVGHIMGTCTMGDCASKSVVDPQLRSWDHPNLFVAGSSVFPTGGTANASLTIAALSCRLGAYLIESMGALREAARAGELEHSAADRRAS